MPNLCLMMKGRLVRIILSSKQLSSSTVNGIVVGVIMFLMFGFQNRVYFCFTKFFPPFPKHACLCRYIQL